MTAPSWAKRRAHAEPMPDAAPVMSATFPFIRLMRQSFRLPSPLHRQLLDAADEVRGAQRRRVASVASSRFGMRAQHLLEHHAQLEARQAGAQAEVRAVAEGDVLVRVRVRRRT